MEDSLQCQASTAQGCHSVKLIIMRIHYVPNVNYFLTRINYCSEYEDRAVGRYSTFGSQVKSNCDDMLSFPWFFSLHTVQK